MARRRSGAGHGWRRPAELPFRAAGLRARRAAGPRHRRLGPLAHARKYFLPFSDTFLPIWSLWAVGVTIPFIELIGGALVLLGLRTRDALIALGMVLVIVTFGHLLHDALFDFSGHVIPRLALLLFVLSLPRKDDRFSLDYFLKR